MRSLLIALFGCGACAVWRLWRLEVLLWAFSWFNAWRAVYAPVKW